MPIKIPDSLPAKEILRNENIFMMDESRAFSQDIRPLKIVILNIMPNKEQTEAQILRLLSNSPLQIDITLLHMESHTSKTTSQEHLAAFYNVFSEIQNQKFDGMVITGAPVEHLTFGEVTYWNELCKIMKWSKTNVYSTFHICWGAMAGLYYHYGISKMTLPQKLSGVFKHFTVSGFHTANNNLTRGFDEIFYAPHSRYTGVRRQDIIKTPELEILSESDEAGVYIAASLDGRQIFIMGHSEYDVLTLRDEYERDLLKGIDIAIPKNYFPNDDPSQKPTVKWRAHSNLLFTNWLNYYVYQETPYDFV